MSEDDKPQKISIGFHGGQSLVARVKSEDLAKLRAALGSGDGWYELQAEESSVLLSLARVDYLLIDTEAHRVGF